uniref:CRAL-TRIO domain-containing protein n=1 Tax=Zooxanthella nutricula TaxID=1333877 RepID=A0A7S2KXY7_9DINO
MGSSTSAACCLRREDPDDEYDGLVRTLSRADSWHSIPESEELWTASDAEEADGEADGSGKGLAHIRRNSWRQVRGQAAGRPLALVPEEALAEGGSPPGLRPPRAIEKAAGPGRAYTEEELRYLPSVPRVEQLVLAAWARRRENPKSSDADLQANLQQGFPELHEWTDQATCLRMLRAMQGDEAAAAALLETAIACRVRDRQLYCTLQCEVACDIRIIGRDRDQRPTIYMCARSQEKLFRHIGPQIQLAFEAAVRLCNPGDEQVVVIADMYKFSASLNMDPYALKEIGRCFGSVYADRFARILVVDFSFIAQSAWTICKPLMSKTTQNKVAFVSVRQAREKVKEFFTGPTCDRIMSSFDINRDSSAMKEERAAHARRTAICDVPLGVVRDTDIAG